MLKNQHLIRPRERTVIWELGRWLCLMHNLRKRAAWLVPVPIKNQLALRSDFKGCIQVDVFSQ